MNKWTGTWLNELQFVFLKFKYQDQTPFHHCICVLEMPLLKMLFYLTYAGKCNSSQPIFLVWCLVNHFRMCFHSPSSKNFYSIREKLVVLNKILVMTFPTTENPVLWHMIPTRTFLFIERCSCLHLGRYDCRNCFFL